ncbi:Pentatricopeptide repeat, partial [Dillenia turbinata]
PVQIWWLQGRWMHAYIDKNKVNINERLFASLIDIYDKCGEIKIASKLFHEKYGPKRQVWPWNAMIGGFALRGKPEEAINLFERMEIQMMSPNEVTFVALLTACSHGKMVDHGRRYFKSMARDYALRGKPEEAINLFEQMEIQMISPNEVTFVALLTACSHGKMVDHGRRYFKSMARDYGIEPELEHYGCVVDLLGHAGLINEVEEIVLNMPMAPDAAIWGALLAACAVFSKPKAMANFSLCHYSACVQTKQLYSFLDEMATKLKIAGYVPQLGEELLDIDVEEALRTPIHIVKNLRVCVDCHETTKFISKVYDREIIVRDRIRVPIWFATFSQDGGEMRMK